MATEEKKKEILSEALYEEFDSTELSTAIRHIDKIRHHLGSSFGECEMRDQILELHRLVMESQNSERHSIEDVSEVSDSIESALSSIIEEAEKLQTIISDLNKTLNIAWTRIEEEE